TALRHSRRTRTGNGVSCLRRLQLHVRHGLGRRRWIHALLTLSGRHQGTMKYDVPATYKSIVELNPEGGPMLYLDSADTDELIPMLATGLFSGVTTNPAILDRAGRSVADLPELHA